MPDAWPHNQAMRSLNPMSTEPRSEAADLATTDEVVIDLRDGATVHTRRATPLPFHRPSVGEAEVAEVADTLRSGWLTTGPKTQRFTEEFCRSVGAPAGLAVSSCTAALHLGLLVADIGPGDVVYTTPVTFAATVQVILHVGARPELVDVEADTLNMDPSALRRAIESTTDGRPAAVMPVHFAGHPCDMAAIEQIAADHNLAIVEDAAHALPAFIGNRMIGSISDNRAPHMVAFSFYATKNLGIGEGGMLTGPEELMDNARVLSLHGMTKDAWKRYQGGRWRYDIVAEGFKYNFTDIQAAIGLHQLAGLPRFQERRNAIVAAYNEAFGQIPGLQVPTERPGYSSAWHLYVLRFLETGIGIDRDGIIDELEKRMISTSVHFIPIHEMTHFAGIIDVAPGSLAVADAEAPRCVSLPLYPAMTDGDVADVIDAVLDVVGTHPPVSTPSPVSSVGS